MQNTEHSGEFYIILRADLEKKIAIILAQLLKSAKRGMAKQSEKKS
jgi:hypothetical protein